MSKARSGGARPAWAPSSWDAGEIEELDMKPYDLARRVREHKGTGLIELDDPEDNPDPAPEAAAEEPASAAEPAAGEEGEASGSADSHSWLTSAVRDQIAHRAQAVGSHLVAGSEDLRHLESELRDRGFEPIASVLHRVSEGAEQLGRSLADGDGERVLDRVREVAGSDPWKIVATGFTAGLLAARAVKAHRAQRPVTD